MTSRCDLLSIELLKGVFNLQLKILYARRYPGYLAYSEIVVECANGLLLKIDLREFFVSSKFEVAVIRVRIGERPSLSKDWDHFCLGNLS